MTNTPPKDDGTRERIMAMETGLRHFREIYEIRHTQIRDAVAAVQEQCKRNTADIDILEEKTLMRIEGVKTLMLSGLKWGAALLATVLLTIVLKGLHLV